MWVSRHDWDLVVNHRDRLLNILEAQQARFDAIEQAQSALLAAVNVIETVGDAARLQAAERFSWLSGFLEGQRIAFDTKLDGIRDGLAEKVSSLESQLTIDFTQLYNGHGLALAKLSQVFDAWNKLAAAKPRRRKKGSKR